MKHEALSRFLAVAASLLALHASAQFAPPSGGPSGVAGQNISPAVVTAFTASADAGYFDTLNARTIAVGSTITGNPNINVGNLNMGTNTAINGGSNSLISAVGVALGGAGGLNQGTMLAVPSVNTSAVGNAADTSEDNLMTYSLPAASMSSNGRGVRITAWGSGVSTTDVTTVRCYFGATAVTTKVLTASQANTWKADFAVIRTGATTQVASGSILNGGTTSSVTQATASPGETLSGAVTIKCTGQRATTSSANSVQQLGMVVEFIN